MRQRQQQPTAQYRVALALMVEWRVGSRGVGGMEIKRHSTTSLGSRDFFNHAHKKSCRPLKCATTEIHYLKDTPRSLNGVYVLGDISMAGLAIDKRSSEP